jgi:hypothetical protein
MQFLVRSLVAVEHRAGALRAPVDWKTQLFHSGTVRLAGMAALS